jgi:hypothetical protein
VDQALRQVKPSSAMGCGADASVTLLDIEGPGGERLLADDFYSGCPWEIHAGRTFATGLPALRDLLNSLQEK